MKSNSLMRANDLAQYLNVSTQTIWRWRKTGLLPTPISLGPRLVAWEQQVIEDWLANQANPK